MSTFQHDLQFLEFQAARCLPAAPARLPEARPHGHGFHLVVASRRGELPAADALHVAAGHDHCDLSALLVHPTDARLAERVADLMPAFAQLMLQSTATRGIGLSRTGRATAWRAYRFESAHRLPNVPPGHKCGRLHGHGFVAVVHADLADRDAPWHADYARLDAVWAPVHGELDRRCLNTLPGLENPTSEHLAAWLWRRLQPELAGLCWVTVFETASCGAHFDGERHRIWKDFSIDSAAREGDLQLGHTWNLRLHLEGRPHPWFGWTLDFADLKRAFEPAFQRLDHQALDAVEDLGGTDNQSIAAWIRDHASVDLPGLCAVEVFDGCGGGARLGWGAGPAPLRT